LRLDGLPEHPPGPGASSVWRIRFVVRPPCGFQARGRTCDESQAPPPSGFCPASEFDPAMPAPRGCTALPRFHAPTAQPFRDEPPLPELPPPGHVASSPFLPASTPCSRRDLPGVSQPGALPGFLPSELRPVEIGPPLDVPSPPAICFPDLRQPPGRSLGERGHASMRAPSVGTVRFRVRGLASGVQSPRRIGTATFGFLQDVSFRLSWAFASLGLSPLPLLVRRSSPTRFRVLVSSRALPAVGPPLVQFRGQSRSGSVPFAPEFQRTGKSAGLFRGCRPLRGFRPRPVLPGCPVGTGVGPAVSDRLQTGYETHFLQPMAFWCYLLQ
jgi:hypothetical protein